MHFSNLQDLSIFTAFEGILAWVDFLHKKTAKTRISSCWKMHWIWMVNLAHFVGFWYLSQTLIEQISMLNYVRIFTVLANCALCSTHHTLQSITSVFSNSLFPGLSYHYHSTKKRSWNLSSYLASDASIFPDFNGFPIRNQKTLNWTTLDEPKLKVKDLIKNVPTLQVGIDLLLPLTHFL